MKIKNILRSKRGDSTPMNIALVLGLLLIVCAMSEFFRLGLIVQGVRDGLQQAVITVATTNYDETYNGLREGYSGGFMLSGDSWQENLDYDNVYYRLDNLLGTVDRGGYHTKTQGAGYEYRLYKLNVNILNTPFTPGNSKRNFEADASIIIEIPMAFGWELVPPLTMEVRTKSAYIPKF